MAGNGIRLNQGLNLQDLNNVGSEGTDFEVDLNSVDVSSEHETNISYNEDIFKSLNYCDWSDESDIVFVTEDGGIKKKIIKPGEGIFIPNNAKVSVNYTMFEEFNDVPFDSTNFRSLPERLRLGCNKILPAFELILPTMKKGEIASCTIKPIYAFGEGGCPPRIKPNMTIICEIEILDFSVECNLLDDYNILTTEEINNITLNDLVEATRSEKEFGNLLLRSGLISEALGKYKRGINLLEWYCRKCGNESEVQDILIPFYLNAALVYLKLSRSNDVIKYCKKALAKSPHNVKALFRLGQAYLQLNDFNEAKINLLKAKKLKPADTNIGIELKKLDAKQQNLNTKEKNFYSQMFSKNLSIEDKNDGTKVKENNKVQFSSEFKELVEKKFKDFINDPHATEMPFNRGCFPEDQQAFIINTAIELGLSVSCKKVNGYQRMKIMKKNVS